MTELDRVGISDNFNSRWFPSFLQVYENRSQSTRNYLKMMLKRFKGTIFLSFSPDINHKLLILIEEDLHRSRMTILYAVQDTGNVIPKDMFIVILHVLMSKFPEDLISWFSGKCKTCTINLAEQNMALSIALCRYLF